MGVASSAYVISLSPKYKLFPSTEARGSMRRPLIFQIRKQSLVGCLLACHTVFLCTAKIELPHGLVLSVHWSAHCWVAMVLSKESDIFPRFLSPSTRIQRRGSFEFHRSPAARRSELFGWRMQIRRRHEWHKTYSNPRCKMRRNTKLSFDECNNVRRILFTAF